jgi:hypothetical protein
MEDYEKRISESKLTREVLFEKSPFWVEIFDTGMSGWWYSNETGSKLKVRNGGFSDLKKRLGYKGHLKDGFYIVVESDNNNIFRNQFISKKHAIKIK